MTQIEKLQKIGIKRSGTPKQGFKYIQVKGTISAEDLHRIKALKIPPAWTEVYINPSSKAKLQVIGKDAAGRWQYLYHQSHVKRQEEKKFERIMKFAESLPRLRKTVEEHLSEPGLGHNKVMACVLKILSTCFIRPGSQVYADENGSYGIATLRRKHVTVKGDLVRFDFPGKRGVRQVREFKDRKIARIISELMKLPGHEVFKYEQDGSLVDVKRRDINQYIKEVMGDQFSSKDFRTWAGTLICACALARAGSDLDESKSARKKKVVSAIKETAEQLGNTPAICRSSYIYPGVLASYEKGIVVEKYFSSIEDLVSRKMLGLHPSEKSLLKLLKQKAA